MDELKLLVEMVKDLPDMALWLVFFYFAFKISIVGSVFGLIRLGVIKLHNWSVTPRTKYVKTVATVEVNNLIIDGSKEYFMSQLRRVKKESLSYIHESDVDWLKSAIDLKKAHEIAKKKD